MQLPYDTFVELWRPVTEPEISVLMPLYQQRQYVRASITSVLSQKDIVAEIIISDDGSKDGTFEEALRVISNGLDQSECRHKIVVRQGKQRLWRDHLPLLVDHACCDLVCQAHGDDVSTTDRCQKLVSVFEADPLISLVASEQTLFVSSRHRNRETVAEDGRTVLGQYTYNEIIDGQDCLVGALLAWRKSAIHCFTRLDSRFSAASHDRILAFRASLTGKVMLVQEPLVKRREHSFQASRRMSHEPYRNCSFGRSLHRISALWAMKRDLYQAADLGLISQGKKHLLEGEIDQRIDAFQQSLIESFRIYTCSGKHITWVDEETLRKLNINMIRRIKLWIKPHILPLWKRAANCHRWIRRYAGK